MFTLSMADNCEVFSHSQTFSHVLYPQSQALSLCHHHKYIACASDNFKITSVSSLEQEHGIFLCGGPNSNS